VIDVLNLLFEQGGWMGESYIEVLARRLSMLIHGFIYSNIWWEHIINIFVWNLRVKTALIKRTWGKGMQAALEYLNSQVPTKEQTTVMYNIVLSSITYHTAEEAAFVSCLAQMEAVGLKRDPITWTIVARRQASLSRKTTSHQ
jgi:hypothetical protein